MTTLPHILLVEDDPRHIEDLEEVLTFAGYQVTQTLSIPEACQLVKENAPSIQAIVLDYYLLNGERGHMLQDYMAQENISIPTVAHSSMANANDHMLSLGAIAAVLKKETSASRQALVQTLTQVLS